MPRTLPCKQKNNKIMKRQSKTNSVQAIYPKHQVFCLDCEDKKILFSSEAKANNFMKYNNPYMEEHTGKKPVRSYYCECCGGWHLTSKSYTPFALKVSTLKKIALEQEQRKNRDQAKLRREEMLLIAAKLIIIGETGKCSENEINGYIAVLEDYLLKESRLISSKDKQMFSMLLKVFNLSVNQRNVVFKSKDYQLQSCRVMDILRNGALKEKVERLKQSYGFVDTRKSHNSKMEKVMATVGLLEEALSICDYPKAYWLYGELENLVPGYSYFNSDYDMVREQMKWYSFILSTRNAA